MTDLAPAPPPEPAPPSCRRRRLRRAGIAAVVALAMYALAGFFGVPLLLRHVALPRLNDQLHGAATVERFACNPFALSLRIEGLDLRDAAGESVAGFGALVGNFQVWDTLFRKGWHFRRATIDGLRAAIVIDEQGGANLATLLKPQPPRAPDAKPSEPMRELPRVVVAEMGLSDASVSLVDRSTPAPFDMRAEAIALRLDGLDTRPDHDNTITLKAQIAEGAAIEGQLLARFDPLTAGGSITLDGARLPRLQPYAQRFADLSIAGGTLSLTASLDVAPLAAQRRGALILSDVTLEGLDLQHAGRTFAAVPSIALPRVLADGEARRLEAGLVTVTAPVIVAERNPQGELLVTRLLRPRPARPPAAATTAPTGDADDVITRVALAIEDFIVHAQGEWTIAAEGIEVRDATADWEDQSTPEPVKLGLRGGNLRAGPTDSVGGYRVPLELDLTLVDGGRVAAKGEAQAAPTRLALDLQVSDAALGMLAPYLPTALPDPLPAARLADARATLQGRINVELPASGLRADWTGLASLASLRFERADGAGPLVACDRLAIDGAAGIEQSGDALAATWKGSTEVDGFAAAAPVAGPVEASFAELSIDGTLEARLPASGDPQASFQGDLALNEARASAPEVQKADASVAALRASGLTFALAERSLAIERLELDRPGAAIEAAIAPPPTAEAGAPPAAAAASGDAPAAPLRVRIAQLVVNGASARVVDPSALVPLEVVAEQVDLKAGNLSNDGATVGDIEMTGRVQGTGRIEMRGTLDPFDPARQTDLRVDLSGVPLKPYEAISASQVGHGIESGRLTLGLPIRIEGGRLDGHMELNLDRLYLADIVAGARPPTVPVKLGLDLLRDPQEQIRARIGVQGDMNEPGFSFGGILWQAFFNLLLKATTAPFTLLGAAFGAGDRDISQVVFEPGSADLAGDALSTIDIVGDAMAQRPRLKLQALPGVDPSADGAALRLAALRAALLEQAKRRDRRLASLDAEQYLRQLQQAHDEAFGRRPRDAEPLGVEQLEAALVERVDLPPETLRDLARRRGEAVAAALQADAGIGPDRVEIVLRDDPTDEAPRVRFELAK